MTGSVQYVLVTGATGFIGAHVVDELLGRGIKVRGTTRSTAKAEAMLRDRPQYASQLDFVRIDDFEKGGSIFDDAIRGIDAVVHVASPFTYDVKDNEKELIIPAINGTRAILEAAAAKTSTVKRIVITSSFAAVMTDGRKGPPYFTYTAADWNPLSYEEAADPATSAVAAYRGAKKFAEKAAWDFVRERRPPFDLVALCPPMTFGPVAHPVADVAGLNESNAALWRAAAGPLPAPVARVPFWVDVRDLAVAHAEALLRPGAGGKRFLPASPERFSYALAARIVDEEFDWARGRVAAAVADKEQEIDDSHGVDGETAARELGLSYRSFRETVTDLVFQAKIIEAGAQLLSR